jgi:hypothetical protein
MVIVPLEEFEGVVARPVVGAMAAVNEMHAVSCFRAHGTLEGLLVERFSRHDGCHIAQPLPRDGLAQGAVAPITCIHQHHAGATPAGRAARICSSAICGLVLNLIARGTCALARRDLSLIQSRGRYSR